MLKRSAVLFSLSLLMVTAALPARAADPYPSKPVRVIVPFGPGGSVDLLPRLIGAKLSQVWGQPFIVENRPGAAGNIGMDAAARADADGYTLVSAPVGNLAINPHLYPNLKFDVFKSFTPITLIGTVQNVVVVGPAVTASSLPDLLAQAKAKPGMLTFGSGGVGTQAHIGGELLASMAGVEMKHVAYKGVGDSVKDLLGGQISMIVAQVPAVTSFIQAGRLKPLAVASSKRIAALPNVPTVDEAAGLKGYEAVSWYALMGPAGMPREVVTKIQADVGKVLAMPEIREKLQAVGTEPMGSTPEQLAALMHKEHARYGEIIRKAGIRID
ncbi:Bug family tripartite tricarboxylate transporter substrate binding protein [Imbroritus primus]|uniref:Bug family tripartite tricarboxylate transporter substrate binding protein n=1 Tax=Imbroritus primus TaxID=3058603 RepID=UPI003D16149B